MASSWLIGCRRASSVTSITRSATHYAFLFICVLMLRPIISQEAPMPGAVMFEENALYRTQLCEREKKLFANEYELRHVLEGMNLSVFMTDYTNSSEDFLFSLDDGNIPEKNPGLMPELLDEVAKRGKFTWRNRFGTGSHSSVNNWTEYLEWASNTYDIAADFWDESNERRAKGMSYSEHFYDNSIILVAKTKKKYETFSFMRPFHRDVWILIAVSIFLTGFLYNLFERMGTGSDERHPDLLGAAFLSAITFTGHFEFKPNSHAARLVSFSWSFWALITMSAYTANLATFLLSPERPSIPVKNLKDVVRLNKSICLWDSTNHDEYFKKRFPEFAKSGKVVRCDGNEDIFHKTLNGTCDVALTGKQAFELFQRDEILNADCSLSAVGEVLKEIPSGFVTVIDTGSPHCTSLVHYVLDLHLSEMKNDGFFQRSWEKVHKKIGTQKCGSGSELLDGDQDSSQLKMRDMQGIFILHLICCVTSILMALGLKWFYSYAAESSEEEDLGGNRRPRRLFVSANSNIFNKSRKFVISMAKRKKKTQRQSIWAARPPPASYFDDLSSDADDPSCHDESSGEQGPAYPQQE